MDINSFVKYTYGLTEYDMQAENALSRAKSSWRLINITRYLKKQFCN